MPKNYLTKEGYEKLVAELHDLKQAQLPAVIQRISEAREMWDLSENFDYKSALEDRDLIDNRIAEVERLIEDVEIISDKKHAKWDTVVDYGSRVTVKMEDGKKSTVTFGTSYQREKAWRDSNYEDVYRKTVSRNSWCEILILRLNIYNWC